MSVHPKHAREWMLQDGNTFVLPIKRNKIAVLLIIWLILWIFTPLLLIIRRNLAVEFPFLTIQSKFLCKLWEDCIDYFLIAIIVIRKYLLSLRPKCFYVVDILPLLRNLIWCSINISIYQMRLLDCLMKNNNNSNNINSNKKLINNENEKAH